MANMGYQDMDCDKDDTQQSTTQQQPEVDQQDEKTKELPFQFTWTSSLFASSTFLASTAPTSTPSLFATTAPTPTSSLAPRPFLFRPTPIPTPPEPTRSPEPTRFDDDESLPVISTTTDATTSSSNSPQSLVTVKTIPELPAVASSESVSTFAALVGVRAPPLLEEASSLARAPIDLVTVLDVSGSMGGSKISLLKQAVRFLIQNLGHYDRLAIVVFSSDARRIFPLRRMSERGREDALRAVDSLSAGGSTNITDGLKKGARILRERRERNPVSSIILLSDGQDNQGLCNIINPRQNPQNNQNLTNSRILESMNLFVDPPLRSSNNGEVEDDARPLVIPVHTFGFGSDHDAASLHAISDASGGTFSFIESVEILQEAFARCIGGLLSVVAQELRLTVRSVSSGVNITSIPSGRYESDISEQGQQGLIYVGDLYADEEKEFLVYLMVPVYAAGSESGEEIKKTSLLDVKCSYKQIGSTETVVVQGERVEVRRPDIVSPEDSVVSLEVDRQRNRNRVAEGIAEAQAMAEQGNLEGARAVLASRESSLQASAAAQAGDGLSLWLQAELAETRARFTNTVQYAGAGRAFALSAMSSHSNQRAASKPFGAAATSFASRTAPQAFLASAAPSASGGVYDTPAMARMVTKSRQSKDSNP